MRWLFIPTQTEAARTERLLTATPGLHLNITTVPSSTAVRALKLAAGSQLKYGYGIGFGDAKHAAPVADDLLFAFARTQYLSWVRGEATKRVPHHEIADALDLVKSESMQAVGWHEDPGLIARTRELEGHLRTVIHSRAARVVLADAYARYFTWCLAATIASTPPFYGARAVLLPSVRRIPGKGEIDRPRYLRVVAELELACCLLVAGRGAIARDAWNRRSRALLRRFRR